MKKKTALLLALLFVILCFVSCDKTGNENKAFTIDLLKTGDSDCTIICAGDKTILIDTADKDDYSLICNTFAKRNIDSVDLMILTHFDNDHIGSAPSIIFNFDVKEVVVPDYVRSSSLVDALNRAIRNTNTVLTVMKGGSSDRIVSENGAVFTINAPSKAEYSDDNDYSLITSLTVEGKNFLFLGDALKERMGEYIPSLLGSYYLVKLPHHGDYNANTGKMLDSCDITYAVVNTVSVNDAEIKLREKIQGDSPSGLYTCNGTISVEYENGEFTLKQ